MCEKQRNCGLYNFLVETGKITDGQICPKPDPADCPRYKFDDGQNVEISKKVFRVENVYTYELPISHEEMKL